MDDEEYGRFLAEEGYKAYTAFTDNKNYRGEECPKWEDLPVRIQYAWKAAALRIGNKVQTMALASERT